MIQREKETSEEWFAMVLFRVSHTFAKHRRRLCLEVREGGAGVGSGTACIPCRQSGHHCPKGAPTRLHTHTRIQSDGCCCWQKW